MDDLAGQALDLTKLIPGIGGSDPKTEGACDGSADDSCCKTTGVTDSGIIKSARLRALLNAGVMVYNTLNSLRMAKLQRDLGERYLKLAEDHRNYYNTRYKPLEESLAKEALALKTYKRDKEQLNTGQMLISARNRTAGALNSALSCTGRYCTGQRAAIVTDQLMQQSAAEVMVAGLAHRFADKEEIIHNNLRWEKREQVLRIGRDIPTEAVSYASLATGIFGRLGKQAGQAAEGAMSMLGYGRGETQYPNRRGAMTVSEYRYIPTRLEPFKPQPTDNYTKPEPETQTIDIRG